MTADSSPLRALAEAAKAAENTLLCAECGRDPAAPCHRFMSYRFTHFYVPDIRTVLAAADRRVSDLFKGEP